MSYEKESFIRGVINAFRDIGRGCVLQAIVYTFAAVLIYILRSVFGGRLLTILGVCVIVGCIIWGFNLVCQAIKSRLEPEIQPLNLTIKRNKE